MSLWRLLGRRELPRTCFISHSYADAHLVGQLKQRLPQYVEPVVFPPIVVPAEQRVSDDLVSAILSCDGLVYIDSKNSNESVWVNFERDLAMRNKRPVYSFNPVTQQITRNKSANINPRVVTWLWGDAERAQWLIEQVQSHMRTRGFELETQMTSRIPDHATEDIIRNLTVELSQGQSLVLYACNGEGYDGWESFFNFIVSSYRSQVLIVALEPIKQEDITKWFPSAPRVELFDPTKGFGIDWRRVDDLIVRIFHMGYNSKYAKRA